MIPVYRACVVFLVFIFFVGLMFIYVDFIQISNAYLGYRELIFDAKYFLWLLVFLLLTLPFLSSRFKTPSDVYIFFHIIFVVLPFSLLALSGTNHLSWSVFLFFLLIIFPVYLIRILRGLNLKFIHIPRIIDRDFAYFVILAVTFVLVGLAFMNAPQSSSLDINSAYIRRIEGRSSYPVGSLLAYSNSIVMNGFLPLLAFWAGVKRSKYLLLAPIIGWLSFYYLIGTKAPILYIAFSFFLGVVLLSKSYRLAVLIILMALVTLLIVSVLELYFFDYSYLADYFFRRAFTVPAFLISTYSDFFAVFHISEWSYHSGLSSEKPVSLLIGEDFMGREGLNANTNTYVYAFISDGLFSYFFVCLVVAMTFVIMDLRFKARKSPEMVYCGFIFGILLLEQYVGTVFLSSGFFVVLLVSLLIKDKQYYD
ncbi:hypothetical protein ACB040_12850 [Aeromonas sp. S11(2024)]|uniref:hypothetical protein n=1 Tax=unclassified Aeromonas TaxID=257493 RepID=UPI003527214D